MTDELFQRLGHDDVDEVVPLILSLCRECSLAHTWEASGICIRCRLQSAGLI